MRASGGLRCGGTAVATCKRPSGGQGSLFTLQSGVSTPDRLGKDAFTSVPSHASEHSPVLSHPFTFPCPLPPLPLFPPRYELECKYTQFIEVHSRPVMPRVDMAALVRTTPKP